MIGLCLRLIRIFVKEDHVRFLVLFLGILLTSVMEIIGIGLILPFIALLGRPGLLTSNVWLHRFYQASGCQTFNQFMAAMAVGIALVFVLKNAALFLNTLWQTRFVFQKQSYLVCRLFRAYLMSPYSFHLRRDIGRLKHSLDGVSQVMNGVVLQILYMATELVLVAFLFVFLLIMYPLLTFIVMVLLASSLFVFFSLLKQKLKKWGEIAHQQGVLRVQDVEQGLGSIKEAKLWGKELFFVQRYSAHCREENRQVSKNEVMMKSTRLFIETMVVVLIMSAMTIFLITGHAPEKILMTLSIFAIVAVRLMPSLNRISTAWGNVKFFAPAFDVIYDDLLYCERMDEQHQELDEGGTIGFQDKIRMRDVSFIYENTKAPALRSFSAEILKNTTVGFVGASGAGKSTAVDIMMGLLFPSSGEVLVDGVDIRRHVRSWQRKIGYIPQMIYLCDDTIKSNIAFGVMPNDIDEKKVWQALRLAQLEDFVRSLALGVDTVIGERGVRLSGGQRQRISIARALYHDPEVLVMDEATAALDNETERDFMAALDGLSGGKTIVVIAHRLTTVQSCDKIFFLKAGELIAQGTYDQLMKTCPQFRDMAMASRLEGDPN